METVRCEEEGGGGDLGGGGMHTYLTSEGEQREQVPGRVLGVTFMTFMTPVQTSVASRCCTGDNWLTICR